MQLFTFPEVPVSSVLTGGVNQPIDQLTKKHLNEDTYPFQRPEEVRVSLKNLSEKINEIGRQQAA
jgi:hypothetical protein